MQSVARCRLSATILVAASIAISLGQISSRSTLCAQEESFEKLQPRIEKLIEQMGADSFAAREQAQVELRRIGPVAFDALRRAQDHNDIEIARRAQYLVRLIQVRWPRPGDPAEVLRVLERYGSSTEAARSRMLDRLAALIDAAGVPALCRVARFDASPTLSKRAALLVAEMPMPTDIAQREARAALITHELGVSRREASDWLRALATTLKDPGKSVDAWDKIVAQALQRRDRLPDETNDMQVRRLIQLQTDVLIQVGQRDQATRQALRMLKLVRARRDTLLDTIDWLMERELFGVIDKLMEMYPQHLERFVALRYRLAESLMRQGMTERAEATALAALKSQPDQFESHIEAAVELQQRTLMDWSLRELNGVVERRDNDSLHHLRARLMLSEIHHDYERELLAAESLAPVVKMIDQGNEDVSERIGQPPLNRSAPGVKTRMHLFYSRHFREKKEYDKEIEHLQKGAGAEPNRTPDDADLLIAMHHARNADDQFKKQTATHIESYLRDARNQIRQLKNYEMKAPNESTRNDINNAMAGVNNQLAWLASNTGGDLKEATAASHRSLELRPNTAAYLDTLAHCYAAAKNYKEAVKYQAKAAELEPYSFQIVKKVKEFQSHLDKAQDKPSN